MRGTHARCRVSGLWISLAIALVTWPFSVAYAGLGVWTSGGPNSGDVWALAINPTTPATLYAGMNGGSSGVFKSTDSGGTWVAANTGLTTLNVYALAINPTTPATLYAGTYVGGVFKSTDSGATWAAANAGLTITYVNALVINPTTPATLYAGTAGGGVFKSTDSGGTWAAANTGLGNLAVYALAINPTTPATLYAGTYGGGVFRSTDSGGTWAAANTGLTNWVVQALAIDSTAATLYAGTFGGGVFKSADSGGTWAAANTGLTNLNVRALALNPTGATTLYAGLASGGVWQTTGTVQSGCTLPSAPTAGFTFSPSQPGIGQVVQFSDTSTGGPTSWTWSFGDGASSSGQTAVHVYTQAGSYTVTLVVANCKGSSQKTDHISVASSEPPKWVVPGMAYAQGAIPGTVWQSEVTILNPDPALPATYSLAFLDGRMAVDPKDLIWKFVTLGPQQAVSSSNVLGDFFGQPLGSFGALIVRGDVAPVPPSITSRTFNNGDPTKGTFGLSVPPTRALSAGPPQGATAPQLLIGLRDDDVAYTNIGLVNLISSDWSHAHLTFFDAAGAMLGSLGVDVPPYGVAQLNRPLTKPAGPDGLGLPPLALFRVQVTVDAGGSVYPYATVINVRSTDPIVVTPPEQLSAVYRVPGVVRAPGQNGTVWRSRFFLTNPSSAGRSVNLVYSWVQCDRTGCGGRLIKAQDIRMGKGETRSWEDFPAEWLTGSGTGFYDDVSCGDSFIDVAPTPGDPNQDPLLVLAETYNSQPTGPVGLQLSGFTDLDGGSKTGAGKGLVLTGLASNAGYRTNVAFFLTSSNGTTGHFNVRVLSEMGVTVRTFEWTLTASSPFKQFSDSDLFGGVNKSDRMTIIVDSFDGSPVGAYATIIDNTSGDATFVKAQTFNLAATPGGPYSVTISASGTGSGTVAANPSGPSYASGTAVTLTATANAGSTFAGWSGDCSGTNATCTLTMNANKSVTAAFNALLSTYTLTTSIAGTGSGVISPTSGIYASSTVVTLTATPNTGSTFSGWSGDCAGAAPTCAVTMNANRSVTATFNIAISAGPTIISVDTLSPTPLTTLTIITSAIDLTSPVSVQFSNGAGYSAMAAPIRVSADGTVTCPVPLYIDPVNGQPAQGTVSLALKQGTRYSNPVSLSIQDLPPLSAYGTSLGEISHAALIFDAILLARRIGGLQALQFFSAGNLDTSSAQATLTTTLTAVIQARGDIDRVMANNSLVITHRTLPDGTSVQFDKDALERMDRILAIFLARTLPAIVFPAAVASRSSTPASAQDVAAAVSSLKDYLPYIESIGGILSFEENTFTASNARTWGDEGVAVIGGVGAVAGMLPPTQTTRAIGTFAACVTAGRVAVDAWTDVVAWGWGAIKGNRYLMTEAETAMSSIGDRELLSAAVGLATVLPKLEGMITLEGGSAILSFLGLEKELAQWERGASKATIDLTQLVRVPVGIAAANGVVNVATTPGGPAALAGLRLCGFGAHSDCVMGIADPAGNYELFLPMDVPYTDYSDMNLRVFDPVSQDVITSRTVDLRGLNTSTPVTLPTVTIGPACSYSINPTSRSFGSDGGGGSVAVAVGNGCAWTASSNDSWITVVSGSSGSGPGTVNYSVAANTTTAQRSGTMTIAGKSFIVTQAGNTPTITVSKAGTGSGTVTSSPTGISCGATCSASYASLAAVTLTATPAVGSTFTGWSGACSGTAPTCPLTMDADKNVTATFTLTVAEACTYVYSAWSLCQPNNTQTRSVISSSPPGCIGTPVLSQACTPAVQYCVNEWRWIYPPGDYDTSRWYGSNSMGQYPFPGSPQCDVYPYTGCIVTYTYSCGSSALPQPCGAICNP